MLRWLSAISMLILILAQPAAVLAGGFGAGTEKPGIPPGVDKEDWPVQAPVINIVPEREAGSFPASRPQDPENGMHFSPSPEDRMWFPPSHEMAGEFMAGPLMGPDSPRMPLSKDLPVHAIVHRGELDLNGIHPSLSSPMLAYGPNTPPPASGDWVINQAGNYVDNTTIILNGDLKVTAGDLTLDNVTLIMNCTVDGQYQINVSAGGTLNVTNTCITAFNGSLHYKFRVHGSMNMDRCDVSEMWGDNINYWEG